MNNTEKKIVEMLRRRADEWYKAGSDEIKIGDTKTGREWQEIANGLSLAIQYIQEGKK